MCFVFIFKGWSVVNFSALVIVITVIIIHLQVVCWISHFGYSYFKLRLVSALQILLVLLNSSWISAYTYDDILGAIQIIDKIYCTLNSQNQVKFYV